MAGVARLTEEIPADLASLFWDCDPCRLSLASHRSFIIGRLLDRGDWRATQWLRRVVGDGALRDWLIHKKGGGLDPRKLRFWGLILDLPDDEVDRWCMALGRNGWEGRRRG